MVIKLYIPQKRGIYNYWKWILQEKNDDRKVYGDTIYVNQLSGEARVKGSEQNQLDL